MVEPWVLRNRARGRGRPRAAEPMISTNIRLPVRVFDAYCQAARESRTSLQDVIRRTLADQPTITTR